MTSPPAWRRLLVIAALGAAAAAAVAQPPTPVSDNVQKSDCRIWAKRFDPFRLEWSLGGGPNEGGAGAIRCVTRIDDGGRARKGAKVTLGAELTDPAGNAVSLGTRSARTDASGVGVIVFPLAGVTVGPDLVARVEGRYWSWKKATTIATECSHTVP